MACRQHLSFRWPDNLDTKIWRYLDLAKFVSLLQERALWFARADCLDDPFEGSSTKRDLEVPRSWLRAIRQQTTAKGQPSKFTDEFIEKQCSRLSEIAEETRSEMFISCWHLNEHESAAMWRLYSKSDDAIAIQTTVRKFIECLPQWTYVGQVEYIDYDRDETVFGNAFNPFLRKRKSFEHERELRAIASLSQTNEFGIAITETGVSAPIELEKMIERIYVSPTSASWFGRLVQKLVVGEGLRVAVEKSRLAERPIF